MIDLPRADGGVSLKILPTGATNGHDERGAVSFVRA